MAEQTQIKNIFAQASAVKFIMSVKECVTALLKNDIVHYDYSWLELEDWIMDAGYNLKLQIS